MTTTKKRSKLMLLAFGLLAAMLMLANPMTAYAANAFNPPLPRSQPAPEQQRFNWAYEFENDIDFRFDLGRPTTWSGVVPQDVFTANVRRDANVSFRPPGPRTGNAITATDPSNWTFTRFQPHQNVLHINGFWNPVELQNPNAMPHFDLQQHGINAAPQGNPIGIQTNVPTSGASQGGSGGFLPPTSIGN
ncbi:MAG: hypothetical protein FWF79_02265 [Defluviitaleaceae bacterium]|nr:hypothetical protein [Defluviitaleaceae bacterium]